MNIEKRPSLEELQSAERPEPAEQPEKAEEEDTRTPLEKFREGAESDWEQSEAGQTDERLDAAGNEDKDQKDLSVKELELYKTPEAQQERHRQERNYHRRQRERMDAQHDLRYMKMDFDRVIQDVATAGMAIENSTKMARVEGEIDFPYDADPRKVLESLRSEEFLGQLKEKLGEQIGQVVARSSESYAGYIERDLKQLQKSVEKLDKIRKMMEEHAAEIADDQAKAKEVIDAEKGKADDEAATKAIRDKQGKGELQVSDLKEAVAGQEITDEQRKAIEEIGKIDKAAAAAPAKQMMMRIAIGAGLDWKPDMSKDPEELYEELKGQIKPDLMDMVENSVEPLLQEYQEKAENINKRTEDTFALYK